MFRKITVILAALAATAALAAPASAATPSKVTIQYLGGGEFTGKVKSADADCIAERTVVLYEMSGATPSPKDDQKIVKDTTDEDGRWNTGQTGYTDGEFYAKVKRTEDCRSALSKVIIL